MQCFQGVGWLIGWEGFHHPDEGQIAENSVWVLKLRERLKEKLSEKCSGFSCYDTVGVGGIKEWLVK